MFAQPYVPDDLHGRKAGGRAERELCHREPEARYLAQIPMNRLGNLDEIGAAVAFLASANASFITGQTLFVDGGASLGRSKS
jgi:NAD(P)-dependent dehydrogenase (short-subunit alcohol dehydrogenase family)